MKKGFGVLMKLFMEEKWLAVSGLLGFLLAFVCILYIAFNGEVVLPEGNIGSAFSFNAAIGMFILSISALLPLSGIRAKKRFVVRWGLILCTLIGYGIETVQHFRGINPRFTRAGSVVDIALGGFFGLISILLVVFTVMIAFSFFKVRDTASAPLLISIRYAFLSTMIAFAAGVLMIVIQSRYFGTGGNFIVLHGLGFHSLQALPVLGWLASTAYTDQARRLVHIGGISWLLSILFIGVQTAIGRSAFDFTLFSVISVISLGVSFITIFVVSVDRLSRLQKV